MSAEPVDLDAVTRLLTGLPRGPWHVEYFGDDGYPQRIANAGAVIVAETHQGGTGLRPTPEFIAQARTLVPRMADEIAALRGENARLREGEDATPRDPGCEPTPGQWLHRFNSAAPAQRLTWAKDILRHARDSSRCQFELDHAGQIAELRAHVQHLQRQVHGLEQPIRDAALAALDAMRAGQHAATDRALNQLRDQYGMTGITTALMYWCDAALARMPPRTARCACPGSTPKPAASRTPTPVSRSPSSGPAGSSPPAPTTTTTCSST
ncbi:hypothetical protein [Actinomadura madurae]|uniref:hypothetical protein n=1 Tax=Actinomadura madurae TaxID=1993 RepID=UPI0020D20BF5|nr:hypothetical protein [Actinomadura madurae]MCP9976469.1 hypothetical protein [Actinomadura madurae]MCQ0012037.1 hypothetical protein [Actinomadura madurae]